MQPLVESQLFCWFSNGGRTLTEPDVTLTDYGLTVLCAWCAWSHSQQKTRLHHSRALWTLFFASLSVASLTGGTVHGFFLDTSTLGHRLLWPATLIAIGVTAASAWILTGLSISTSLNKVTPWTFFAVATFLIYATVVLFYSQRFLIVIVNYVPAMMALLIVSVRDYARTHSPPFLLVTAGIVLTFVAASLQQAGLGIHPNYFNHNSTYHLVQAVGLFVLFRGAIGLTSIERTAS